MFVNQTYAQQGLANLLPTRDSIPELDFNNIFHRIDKIINKTFFFNGHKSRSGGGFFVHTSLIYYGLHTNPSFGAAPPTSNGPISDLRRS